MKERILKLIVVLAVVAPTMALALTNVDTNPNETDTNTLGHFHASGTPSTGGSPNISSGSTS